MVSEGAVACMALHPPYWVNAIGVLEALCLKLPAEQAGRFRGVLSQMRAVRPSVLRVIRRAHESVRGGMHTGSVLFDRIGGGAVELLERKLELACNGLPAWAVELCRDCAEARDPPVLPPCEQLAWGARPDARGLWQEMHKAREIVDSAEWELCGHGVMCDGTTGCKAYHLCVVESVVGTPEDPEWWLELWEMERNGEPLSLECAAC